MRESRMAVISAPGETPPRRTQPGRVIWTPRPSDVGQASFLVRVSDDRGGFADRLFLTAVSADTEAPHVTVDARITRAPFMRRRWSCENRR